MDHHQGYTGKLLRVDLTTRKVSRETIDTSGVDKFIGGRGLNAKYLFDELKPGIDPLSPDNKIIFGVGPCAGTTVPGSQRFTATSKSPLTGLIGDSNSGGDFGAVLKYAGYDMVIVEGCSEEPLYLFINDDIVEFKKAELLWGKTTFQARRMIEVENNDPDLAAIMIGPGGENLVKYANIMAELGRASGRTGMGAVMGSKKLKAIAVRGSKGVKIADYETLQSLNRENNSNWIQDADVYHNWTKYGPSPAWKAYSVCGMFPVKNYQQGTFQKDLFEELVQKEYFVSQKACISCPLGCNHAFVLKEGAFKGVTGEGIELDQLGDFGPRVGNEDLALALGASTLCDEYGIDIMDTTAMISFAMECREKGILSRREMDGLSGQWGDAETILGLIEMIAYRKGLGETLAEGLKRAPKVIGKGSEKYAMHSKGQTLVMRHPAASKAWALMFATSSRGACHMRALVPEGYSAGGVMGTGIWDKGALEMVKGYEDPLNPHKEEGKPELVVWYENLRAFQDTLEVCRFSLYNSNVDTHNKSIPALTAKLLNAVTGRELTADEGLLAGERIVNLERLFNLREGLTKEDDSLPERMLNEPLPDGPAKGQVVDLEPMIAKYYQLRGWHIDTGIPTVEKLKSLGLSEGNVNPGKPCE